METGVLLLVCIAILAVSGALRNFNHSFSYPRENTLMLCVTLLAFNIFQIQLLPELSINPAAIALILLLVSSVVKRDEYKLWRFIIGFIIITPLMLICGTFFSSGGEVIGLTGILAPAIFGVKRTSLSMLCVAASAFTAYCASIFLSTAFIGGIYAIFDSKNILNAQIVSITTACAASWLISSAKQYRLRHAALKH